LHDGLKTGSLREAGIDSLKIGRMLEQIEQGQFNEIHSMLVYKNDMLVLEEYFMGHQYQWDAPHYYGEYVQWKADMLHPMMSCSKSLTSACIGIAVDEGFIHSVDDPIFAYLPGYEQYNTGGKEAITVEHLLTMTSGLAWNEWGAAHGTAANDIDRLYFVCSSDPIKCVLERDLVHPPGEVFTYNGGGIVILGEILKNASGMDIAAFFAKYIEAPLGIDSVSWFRFDNGTYAIEGSISMKPRDMLKLGITYLDSGRYQGTRVLSPGWVEKSQVDYANNSNIRIPIEDSGKNGYGYTWWTSRLRHKGKDITMYRANGWGGQTIMVFPELDMVVVFTGGNYAEKSKLFRIVSGYLLPALE